LNIQSTDQPKCNKKQGRKGRIKNVPIRLLKAFLKYLLLNPKTWQWMMVKLPEFFEKIWVKAEEIWSSFIDFFS